MGQSRELFAMEGVEAQAWQTDDLEVAVIEITHHGRSGITGAPCRFTALGVIRVPYRVRRRHRPGTR